MGLFSKKEEMTDKLKAKLDKLAEKGNAFEKKGQPEKAIAVWREAIEMIPHPNQMYSETMWFHTAIGDVLFSQEKYAEALSCFEKAKNNIAGGSDNPFVLMRYGQCCLETGDEKNAAEYLLRAYMLEGEDIFEGGEKYLDFLKANVDLSDK